MLGALPLAFGIGEGSELRRPLGISIVGGLIVSQMLTLYTTPVIYLYLDRFRLWARRAAAARRSAAAPASDPMTATGDPCRCASAAPAAGRGRRLRRGLHGRPRLPAPAGARPRRPSRKRRAGSRRSPATPPTAATGGRSTTIRCSIGSSGRSTVSNQTLKAAEAAYRQARGAGPSRRVPALFPTVAATALGDALAAAAAAPARARRGIGGAAPAPSTHYSLAGDGRAGSLDIWGKVRRTVESDGPPPRPAPPTSPRRGSRRRRRWPPTTRAAHRRRVEAAARRHGRRPMSSRLQITRNQYAAGVAARSDVAQAETQLDDDPGPGDRCRRAAGPATSMPSPSWSASRRPNFSIAAGRPAPSPCR